MIIWVIHFKVHETKRIDKDISCVPFERLWAKHHQINKFRRYDNKHTSNVVIGGSMVFNIFTARFMRLRKTCEAIKSSKPVFLCTTSFAEANQLCIRDGMLPSWASSTTLRLDASCSSYCVEDEGFEPDGIGLWVGKLAYSGVMAV